MFGATTVKRYGEQDGFLHLKPKPNPMPTLNKELTAKFYKSRSSGMHAAGKDTYPDGTWQGDTFKELDAAGVPTSTYNSQVNAYNGLEDDCDNGNLYGTDDNNNTFQISVLPQRPRPKPK